MVDWVNLLFMPLGLGEEILGTDLTTIAWGDDPVGAALTLDMSERHEKLILAGAGLLGAAAFAPAIYDLTVKKSRSKRKQAKQAQERAALEKASSSVRDGLKTAFLAPTVALPATLLTLEMLGRFPKAKVVYHPEEGHWEPGGEL